MERLIGDYEKISEQFNKISYQAVNNIQEINRIAESLLSKTKEVVELAATLQIVSKKGMTRDELWVSNKRLQINGILVKKNGMGKGEEKSLNDFCARAVEHVTNNVDMLKKESEGQDFTLPQYLPGGWQPCKIVSA